MSDTKTVNLEKALADLEKLVEDLESGDLPLEKAMKKFEDGIKLTRSCQSALKDAEQKVQVLIRSAGGDESLEDFEGDDWPGVPASSARQHRQIVTDGTGTVRQVLVLTDESLCSRVISERRNTLLKRS